MMKTPSICDVLRNRFLFVNRKKKLFGRSKFLRKKMLRVKKLKKTKTKTNKTNENVNI
jgi:hypothetical protein